MLAGTFHLTLYKKKFLNVCVVVVRFLYAADDKGQTERAIKPTESIMPFLVRWDKLHR